MLSIIMYHEFIYMHVVQVTYLWLTDTLCILRHLNTRGIYIFVIILYYLFTAALEDEEDDFRSEDEEADSDDSLEVNHCQMKPNTHII